MEFNETNNNSRNKIAVNVRLRNLTEDEQIQDKNIFMKIKDTEINKLQIKNKANGNFDKEFLFDCVIDSNNSQQEVFEKTSKNIIDGLFLGFNGTIISYGQTGTGKTHTMMGQHDNVDLKGITPRSLDYIFETIKDDIKHKFNLFLSHIEIYLETIYDLLEPQNSQIRIREDSENNGNIKIEGIQWIKVSSTNDCINALQISKNNKLKLNLDNANVHDILIVRLERTTIENSMNEAIIKSSLYLVDLAGSEKIRRIKSDTLRIEEIKKINHSLVVLGNCLSNSTQPKDVNLQSYYNNFKNNQITYRNSKLTRILQDSLKGNSRISIIINISPSVFKIDNTLSDLYFGKLAMEIESNPLSSLKKEVNYQLLSSRLQEELDNLNDEYTKLRKAFDNLSEQNRKGKDTIFKLQKQILFSNSNENNKLNNKNQIETDIKRVEEYYENKLIAQENENNSILLELDKILLEKEHYMDTVSQENKNIKSECGELYKILAEITKEKDDLLQGIGNSEVLAKKLAEITKERDELLQELANYKESEFTFKKITKERNELLQELANYKESEITLKEITKERDELLKDLISSEELNKNLVEITSERNELLKDLVQYKELNKNLEVITNERDELRKELFVITKESQKLGKDLAAFTNERGELDKYLSLITKERDELRQELVMVTKEREELLKDLTNSEILKLNLKEVITEKDELLTYLANAEKIKEMLTEVIRERDELIKTLAISEELNNKILTKVTNEKNELLQDITNYKELKIILKEITKERDELLKCLASFKESTSKINKTNFVQLRQVNLNFHSSFQNQERAEAVIQTDSEIMDCQLLEILRTIGRKGKSLTENVNFKDNNAFYKLEYFIIRFEKEILRLNKENKELKEKLHNYIEMTEEITIMNRNTKKSNSNNNINSKMSNQEIIGDILSLFNHSSTLSYKTSTINLNDELKKESDLRVVQTIEFELTKEIISLKFTEEIGTLTVINNKEKGLENYSIKSAHFFIEANNNENICKNLKNDLTQKTLSKSPKPTTSLNNKDEENEDGEDSIDLDQETKIFELSNEILKLKSIILKKNKQIKEYEKIIDNHQLVEKELLIAKNDLIIISSYIKDSKSMKNSSDRISYGSNLGELESDSKSMTVLQPNNKFNFKGTYNQDYEQKVNSLNSTIDKLQISCKNIQTDLELSKIVEGKLKIKLDDLNSSFIDLQKKLIEKEKENSKIKEIYFSRLERAVEKSNNKKNFLIDFKNFMNDNSTLVENVKDYFEIFTSENKKSYLSELFEKDLDFQNLDINNYNIFLQKVNSLNYIIKLDENLNFDGMFYKQFTLSSCENNFVNSYNSFIKLLLSLFETVLKTLITENTKIFYLTSNLNNLIKSVILTKYDNLISKNQLKFQNDLIINQKVSGDKQQIMNKYSLTEYDDSINNKLKSEKDNFEKNFDKIKESFSYRIIWLNNENISNQNQFLIPQYSITNSQDTKQQRITNLKENIFKMYFKSTKSLFNKIDDILKRTKTDGLN